MLSETRTDRDNGIKFIMSFNRMYNKDKPKKNLRPKKDFRLIDVSERVRLKLSRRHHFLANLNYGKLLQPNKSNNLNTQNPTSLKNSIAYIKPLK